MKIIRQFEYLWLVKLSGVKQLITCDVREACGCSLCPGLEWQRFSGELPVTDTEPRLVTGVLSLRAGQLHAHIQADLMSCRDACSLQRTAVLLVSNSHSSVASFSN